MVLDKKVTGRAASMPAGLLAGLAVSMGVTLLSVSLVVTLILGDRIPENGIGYCGMLVIPLSVMAGAFTSVKMVKRRRLFVSLAAGVIYLLALAGISVSFFGGVRQGVVPAALLTLMGALAVGLCGVKSHGKGRFDGKKYRPR